MGQDGSVENFKIVLNKTNKCQSAFYYYSGNSFFLNPRICFYDFLKRKKHQYKRKTSIALTGNQTHDLGMYSDQESNLQPLIYETTLQPTGPAMALWQFLTWSVIKIFLPTVANYFHHPYSTHLFHPYSFLLKQDSVHICFSSQWYEQIKFG